MRSVASGFEALLKTAGRHRAQVRPALPEVSPGDRTAPPDFIGVGAQRCGTSWWFDMIARHPAVRTWPGHHHELHFFDEYWSQPFTDADAAAYHRYFPRQPDEIAGEFTPRYLFDQWTPPLIRQAAPDAKILVLLRDPVERFLSGIAHARSLGRTIDASLVSDAVCRGLYAGQLRRLYESFPTEQVLVLQLEQCMTDRNEELARTFTFLGLPVPPLEAVAVDRKVNQSRRAKPDLTDHMLRALARAYRHDVQELADLLPGFRPELWDAFAASESV